ATGRFFSEDPVRWASGQTNAYVYTGGNPVQFNDPFGFESTGTPGNNQAQNKQVSDIVRELGLTKGQRRNLHDEIYGHVASSPPRSNRKTVLTSSGKTSTDSNICPSRYCDASLMVSLDASLSASHAPFELIVQLHI
ncbi:RHS repeat-associated core domain-containing protein, partial [Pseudomonas veronii]|uniref:RHS repeat-associated core domain-containing protein n=1 Tax=Pseudomonas veronii TaxID=76761 RepID=UPI0021C10A61